MHRPPAWSSLCIRRRDFSKLRANYAHGCLVRRRERLLICAADDSDSDWLAFAKRNAEPVVFIHTHSHAHTVNVHNLIAHELANKLTVSHHYANTDSVLDMFADTGRKPVQHCLAITYRLVDVDYLSIPNFEREPDPLALVWDVAVKLGHNLDNPICNAHYFCDAVQLNFPDLHAVAILNR